MEGGDLVKVMDNQTNNILLSMKDYPEHYAFQDSVICTREVL